MKAKSIIATGMAVVGVGAAVVITTPKKLDSKPGYQVEAVTDGKYNVYTIKDGKKTILGKDLNSEQADQFLNHKLNRHNQ